MPHNYLKSIINQGLVESIAHNKASLKENAKDAELKLVKVANIPAGTVLLRTDKIDTQTLFESEKGENKRCDYLLVTDQKLFFIELKTNSKASEKYRDECIMKFNAVDCLSDYIDSVLERIHKKSKFFHNLEKRYILFYKAPPITKTTTTKEKQESNVTAEKMLAVPIQNEGEIDISFLQV